MITLEKNTNVENPPAVQPVPVWVQALLIAAAAIFPYLLVLNATMVSDDWDLIYNAAQTKTGVFSYFLIRMSHSNWAFYRPFADLFFKLDHQIWGVTPIGYHITNITFHTIATLLVWRFGLQVFKREEKAWLLAFAAALLFAIHPRHTESVTWTAGRHDLLCTLFFIAALLVHSRWIRFGRPVYLLWTGILFFLSLISKEAAVVLIPTLFVAGWIMNLDVKELYWKRTTTAFTICMLFFIVYMGLRVNAIGAVVGGYSGDEGAKMTPVQITKSLGTATIAMLVPGNFDAYTPIVTLAHHKPVAGIVGLVGLAALLWIFLKVKSGAFWAGLFLYVLCYSPAFAYNQYVSIINTLAERRLYMPSVGACFALVIIAWKLISLKNTRAFAVVWGVGLIFALTCLITVNNNWIMAGKLAKTVIEQSKSIFEKMPDSQMTVAYLGLPDNYNGAYVMRYGLSQAVYVYGGPKKDVLQLINTAPKSNQTWPRITWTKSDNFIDGYASEPIFKFVFSMPDKFLDMKDFTRQPLSPLDLDRGSSVRIGLRKPFNVLLEFDGENLRELDKETLKPVSN